MSSGEVAMAAVSAAYALTATANNFFSICISVFLILA